jgi:apolipoprotein D and lipocalin family protein
MLKHFKQLIMAVLISFGLFSCAQLPKGAQAINNFDAEKYLGQWYEIARFDFRFERDLNNTTANYSLNEDGTVKVINRGYNYVKKEWSEAEGKAKFVGEKTVASLKVSFFGPFYAPYNVIALDNDYKYALVVGKNLDYLWILAREKTIPEEIKTEYVGLAQNLGFDTEKLIWVEHAE